MADDEVDRLILEYGSERDAIASLLNENRRLEKELKEIYSNTSQQRALTRQSMDIEKISTRLGALVITLNCELRKIVGDLQRLNQGDEQAYVVRFSPNDDEEAENYLSQQAAAAAAVSPLKRKK